MGKKKKKRRRKLRKGNVCLTAVVFIFICSSIIFFSKKTNETVPSNTINVSDTSDIQLQTELITTEPITEPPTEPTTESIIQDYPEMSQNSQQLDDDDITSEYAILINSTDNEIVAYKNYNQIMYPASLTKIMTLIIAVENTENFYDTQLITSDMVDPMVEQDATRAGFVAGETPTINDLLYGLILPSGADASLALAEYVAGSETAFVAMMNQKCQELGLKNTHFTNCVGLHDDNHYSTAEDIAIILEYAMQNEICRKVLTTQEYEIAPTEYNPNGLYLESTMFQRMSGTEMEGVTILGGKTGYTSMAGQCLASFAEINGKEYVMVMANNDSKWYVVYDTLSTYSIYGYGGEAYIPPQ